MTDRIRWKPTRYGGVTGHIGTLEPWLFQVFQSNCDHGDVVLGEWELTSQLPAPRARQHGHSHDPDTLKAEAERWLAEFVSSLGAIFPPGPVVSRCECGGVASHQHGCRWRQGYGSLIESVTDEPTPASAPETAKE